MNANIIELPIKIFLADADDDDRSFFMMALADIDKNLFIRSLLLYM